MVGSEKEDILQRGQNASEFSELAAMVAELGRGFYSRGWALGTSGNFSAVSSRAPLRIAITSSGIDKGKLTPGDVLEIDADGEAIQGEGRPSAETLLHLAVVKLTGAGAVLHTHSVWSNILSDVYMSEGGIHIEGYEMLKGLDGITTHEHREWLPIIENSQQIEALARSVEERLNQRPRSHGFLLRRHGLYTWGRDLEEAKRHVEILEFLLEVMGRTYCACPR
jgi:methylthioribulose-1-phosphate dehydratase